MSKPIVRVVFAVLISLAIIAAVSTNVQASLGNMLRKADANSSILTGEQTLGRAYMGARDYAYFQYDDYAPDSCTTAIQIHITTTKSPHLIKVMGRWVGGKLERF